MKRGVNLFLGVADLLYEITGGAILIAISKLHREPCP
jgi:hypothetical protein